MVLENGLEISCIEESELLSELTEKIQIRRFILHHNDKERLITHYWYRNWPDDTAPTQSQTILTLIETVEKYKIFSESNSPILVHCSAGVGRTGVFITLYHLMQRSKYQDPKINFFDFVAYLHWQRPYVVGVPSQYRFCYNIHNVFQKLEF